MTYRELLEHLDAWFARGRAAAPPGVVPCRSGCSACCHGLFDISAADAELLAEGVAALPEAERAALQARAEAQLEQCAELAPGWAAPWDVEALPEEAFDALCEQLARAPCPVLGPDGACSLYAHRPATCRMTGLPMQTISGPLENECPIQDEHPAYQALLPTRFDLTGFERVAAEHDAQAVERGGHATIVAAACSGAGRLPQEQTGT